MAGGRLAQRRVRHELRRAGRLGRPRRAAPRLPPHLEIAEREDPAYTVLHQTVNFTAKRRELPWKPGQSFGMDFRASNWKA
jgi:hypothetical protein